MGSVQYVVADEHIAINPNYFVPATWEPLDDVGKIQYGKFVAWMIERVQYNECTWLDVRRLVHLIATEHNWDFMNIAMPHLPDINARHPNDKKNFGMGFVYLLKPQFNQRILDKARNFMPERDRYVNGLSDAEVEYLKRSLFGPDRGPDNDESMSRLFKSTLELGFPQPALERLVREAKERGTDIERSFDGLPMNLRMPEVPQEPLAAPPGIQRSAAERAEFKAFYEGPNEEFLDYFQTEGQALDPPPQVEDWPKSPSVPGHGTLAARSKSKVRKSKSIRVSRSDPIDIPYPRRM